LDTSPEAVKDFEAMIHAYWGTILSVDDSAGETYRTPDDMGELENTIFVFTSDNGLPNGEHGMVDKRNSHEPSIHIPLIVRFPGLTPVNKPVMVDKQVLSLDIAPSILYLCRAPPLQHTDGKPFKQVVQGNVSNWRKSWFNEYNY
jgi:arylsulfatase A-like enzyme